MYRAGAGVLRGAGTALASVILLALLGGGAGGGEHGGTVRVTGAAGQRPAPPARHADDVAHERWKRDPAFPRWVQEQRECRANPSRSRELLNRLGRIRQSYFDKATGRRLVEIPHGTLSTTVGGGRKNSSALGPDEISTIHPQSEGRAGSGQSPPAGQQSSVLRTLLEVRLRFEARRLQAGLRTQHADADQEGSKPSDGGTRSPISLREAREAKRLRDARALAAVSEANGSAVPARLPEEAGKCAGTARGGDEQDGQEWECIVCSEPLKDRVLGRVDCNRSHVFCFECIHKWGTSIENSCPLCKQSFLRIDKLILAPQDLWSGRRLAPSAEQGADGMLEFGGKRWKLISSVPVEAKRQRIEEMVPDEEGCAECGGGSSSGILIMCDGCDVSLCLDCADLTEDTVPRESEPWFCHECDESEEATGDRRRRLRRQARQQAQEEQEEQEDARAGAGRRGSARQARQQRATLGEERARRAARALGRSYRRNGRGVDQLLGGFVVDDDGDAFQSQVHVVYWHSYAVPEPGTSHSHICLLLGESHHAMVGLRSRARGVKPYIRHVTCLRSENVLRASDESRCRMRTGCRLTIPWTRPGVGWGRGGREVARFRLATLRGLGVRRRRVRGREVRGTRSGGGERSEGGCGGLSPRRRAGDDRQRGRAGKVRRGGLAQ